MSAGDGASPLSLDEFVTALAPLGAPRRYVVCVSGGRDSMALARLAAAHAERDGAGILAVTVDHGLRPEAAREAEQAAAWCRAAGLDHVVLLWEGDKPAAAVQSAARSARYRLIAELAQARGFDAIVTAHSADDQAETAFMRLARGAGPAGLAAMAGETRIAAGAGAPLRLLRPLLDVPRVRLTATVEACGQAYIDDPSNLDPAFERIRTRALLAALAEQDLLPRDALLRAAARARRAALALEKAENAAFARAGGCFHALGWVSLAAGRLDEAFAPVAARLARAVSGAQYAPGDREMRAALAEALAKGAATLGGALLKRRRDTLFILREPAAVLGRAGAPPLAALRLDAGARRLWDGRFILENHGPAPAEVRPLGAEGLAAMGPARGLHDCPDEALLAVPGPALRHSGAIASQSLAAERFFAPVIRYE